MNEKSQKVMELEKTIFTPALQQAVKTASENGNSGVDILGAAANAYINLVVILMGGPEHAAGIIQAQADYLKTLKEGSEA
jgi:hypothetical protein